VANLAAPPASAYGGQRDLPVGGLSLVQKLGKGPLFPVGHFVTKLNGTIAGSKSLPEEDDGQIGSKAVPEEDDYDLLAAHGGQVDDGSNEHDLVTFPGMESNVSSLGYDGVDGHSNLSSDVGFSVVPERQDEQEEEKLEMHAAGKNISLPENGSAMVETMDVSPNGTPLLEPQVTPIGTPLSPIGEQIGDESLRMLRRHEAVLPRSSVSYDDNEANALILTGQSQRAGRKSSHMGWPQVDPLSPAVLIGVFVACVLIVLCVVGVGGDKALAMFFQTTPTDAGRDAGFRIWVGSLPILLGEDIEKNFRPRGGYDCVHTQPQVDGDAVRIEGRVLPRSRSSSILLQAPMSQRNCVLFSASAAEIRLDGVRAPPVAFHAETSEFEFEPRISGAPSTKVIIQGQDVSLFDMSESSSRREQWALEDAPEHLQDFVRAHRTLSNGGELPLTGSTVLEFTECSLAADANVTVVGELRRAATGELQLWPTAKSPISGGHGGGYNEKTSRDRNATDGEGLTSWERPAATDTHRGKVMISDDPRLIAGHKDATAPDLFGCIAPRSGHGPAEAASRNASASSASQTAALPP